MLTQQQIQQFRVRAKQQGFSDAQIEAEIYRKNQEIANQTKTAQVQQPASVQQSAPAPQGMSVGGLIKNAGQDVLDFAVNTPIQAAKNVAGVGFELGRAIDVARGNNEKAAKAKNPFIDINNIPTLKQLGTGILKNIGNTLGIKQGADGNLVFDPNLALQSAYERPVTTALMAKDLGGGAKKLLTKGSAKDVAESAVAKPNAIEELGSNMRKEVLNPQVKADPFYAENVKALQAVQKKLKLSGSAEVQLDQLPGLFKKTQTEIKTQLAKSKSPEKGVLSSNFDTEVAGANYNIANPEFAKAIKVQRKVLSTVEGKPASVLYEQLGKLRGQLKSTFTKVDRGTTLTPAEEAKLASFNAIKSTIDTVSPEVRALNTLENQMYTISKGLVKSAKKGGIAVPGVGKVGGTVTQTLKDAGGQALETVGGIPGKVADAIPSAPTGMGVAAKLSDLANPTPDQAQPTPTTAPIDTSSGSQVTPSPAQTPTGPFGGLTKQQVITKAFQHGLTLKQIDEVAKMYDQLHPAQKPPSALAQKEIIKAKAATSALDRLGNELIGPNGDLSKVWKSKLPLAPGSQTYRADWGSVIDAIGSFRTGAAYTKEQRADYAYMLPQLGDSKEVIQQKLLAIREELNGYATMMKNTSESGDTTPSYLTQ